MKHATSANTLNRYINFRAMNNTAAPAKPPKRIVRKLCSDKLLKLTPTPGIASAPIVSWSVVVMTLCITPAMDSAKQTAPTHETLSATKNTNGQDQHSTQRLIPENNALRPSSELVNTTVTVSESTSVQ